MDIFTIALCEVQAYVYAAYLARAGLAEADGNVAAAQQWRSKAARLKAAFNLAFWMPEQQAFALALDGVKEQVDAIASNMGHCLWTGIVDDDKAAAVAAHLAGPTLSSGFGVRTLATDMTAYNPMSYHNGSVWPHDTAIAVAGLMRYGFTEEAQQTSAGLVEASEHFGGRLPELFCGFGRTEFPTPVPYPTSCSPQAWAAAASRLILRSVLQLHPNVSRGEVQLLPTLPRQWLPLRMENIPLAGNRFDITLDKDGDMAVTGLPPELWLLRTQLRTFGGGYRDTKQRIQPLIAPVPVARAKSRYPRDSGASTRQSSGHHTVSAHSSLTAKQPASPWHNMRRA